MKVTYQVSDGYAGGSRPLSFNLNPEDFEDCETVAEVFDRISESVQDDFDQRVSWTFLNYDSLSEQVEKLIADKKENP